MTSKIKVDNIENQCGGAVVTKCGGTTTITGSVVKANNIQASDAGNIISQSGTTITLGASGDTINLASGATQSGFGRTGTVDWDTTPKTATFSAVSGDGFFCNTSGGAFTVNLPAGSAGAIVSLADYASTFQTHNLTVAANGSEKIGGSTLDVILATEGQSITLIYVDATEGWVTTADSSENVFGQTFITATVSGSGNTLATAPCCSNAKIATFTGPGTFCVSQIASTAANNVVSYLVTAGGGGGSADGGQPQGGAGGGAGGFREGKSPVTPYTSSPIAAPTGLTVTASPFTITVGGGGPGSTGTATSGNVSTFSTITSAGGGRGGQYNGSPGANGGSGGGGGANAGNGGTGNTPPTSPSQGNNGSPAPDGGTPGAGGGASAAGSGVTGGAGVTSSISSTSIAYAGGGANGTAGGCNGSSCGTGGNKGSNGTTNRGGGGGGNCSAGSGGNGGSGVVIIRYKFQ